MGAREHGGDVDRRGAPQGVVGGDEMDLHPSLLGYAGPTEWRGG
jgi:hypothetical protein